jgi:hypothetical protein
MNSDGKIYYQNFQESGLNVPAKHCLVELLLFGPIILGCLPIGRNLDIVKQDMSDCFKAIFPKYFSYFGWY